MNQKKLPMLDDLRDESDHEFPVRLVLVMKSSRIDAEQLMLHLFATTDLEKTQRLNLNVIGVNGLPATKGLSSLLSEWIDFRLATIERKLNFKLNKVKERIHILEGLKIADSNIDEVIRIIREEDNPKNTLMRVFALTDSQTDGILNLRLRNLAKLEEEKIVGELEGLPKQNLRYRKFLVRSVV